MQNNTLNINTINLTQNNNNMNMNNNIECITEKQKRKRGRPKGSKNKPKQQEDEIVIEDKKPRENQILEQKQTSRQVNRQKASTKKIRKSMDCFFTMKPRVGSKCYYSTEITVDYTPNFDQDATQGSSIIPKLNADNKPHIPGFVMQMDQSYYLRHEQRYKNDHESKILDYTKPKEELYQPKPGKKHNYCCVCKFSYEDYLEHILSLQHKKAYNLNDFAKLIKNISMEYEEVCRQNMKQHNSNNSEQLAVEFNTDDDDCQIVQQDSSTIQQQQQLKCITIKDDTKSMRLQQSSSLSLFKQNSLLNQQPSLTHALTQQQQQSYFKSDSLNNTAITNNNNIQMYIPTSCLSLSTKTPSSHGNFQTPSYNQLSSQQQQQYYSFGQPQATLNNSNNNNADATDSSAKLLLHKLISVNGKRKGDMGGIYGENIELVRKNGNNNSINNNNNSNNLVGIDKIIDLTEDNVLEQRQKVILTAQQQNPSQQQVLLSSGSTFPRCAPVQYID